MSVATNIRIAATILAILAGLVLQKVDHLRDMQAGCDPCEIGYVLPS